MKNTITIIIMTLLLVICFFGIYKLYGSMSMYKDMYEQTSSQLKNAIGMNGDYEKKYNSAIVLLSNKEIEVNAIDAKLKSETKRRKAVEKEYIEFVQKVNSGGFGKVITEVVIVPGEVPVTKEIIHYSDYRIDITTDTYTKYISYDLEQKFGINVYQLNEIDYRAEIIEYNSQTSEPVNVYPVSQFIIEKLKNDVKTFHFGSNFMIGGGASSSLDFDIKPIGYAQISFISYGETKSDSLLRFLNFGVSTNGPLINPISWNVGKYIPLLNDLYIDPVMVGIDWKLKPALSIGISSTF